MIFLRALAPSLFAAGIVLAAGSTASIEDAANRVEQKAALLSAPSALEFRLQASQTLQQRYPGLAQRFIDESLREVRAHPELATPMIKHSFAAVAPKEAAAMFPPDPPAPKPAPGPRPAPPAPLAAISAKIGQMRKLPTDADRAKLTLEVVADIRALPSDLSKLSLSYSLANVVTEGDLGKDALNAAASALALALKENPQSQSFYFVELAKLVRYEHLTPLASEPALDTASALLELHDRVVQEAGFSLTALDGKTYSLDALRGKVVLLNFWATWCPPCRREMPDMETLYKRFASKGLVVLAVSDEKRETVEEFLQKEHYTFPVLLDPARKVNSAFGIEGIPNSFLFDRQGKLVGQSIDMRTERQFLEMFHAAGLE